MVNLTTVFDPGKLMRLIVITSRRGAGIEPGSKCFAAFDLKVLRAGRTSAILLR